MDLNLPERYADFIKTHSLWHAGDHLLIAVSGGLDSITLADLCHKAGQGFSIAHCNFSLRGTESERDEAFVAALAAKMKVNFYCKKFNTEAFAGENKLSIQVAARTLRYKWFNDILKGTVPPEKKNSEFVIKPTLLITAHNLDDNLETVLMNFCKGTGIRGLKGIEPKNEKICRPLLFASRKEIENYANNEQLEWVEDSSNSEIKYTRNYFRHEVIPAIEKAFPQFREQLRENISKFRDAGMLYKEATGSHIKKMCEQKGQEIHIPILKLQKAIAADTIIYEIIKEYGFESRQTGEVKKLFSAANGSYIASPSHRIIRNRNWVVIAPLNQPGNSFLLIEKPGEKVRIDDLQFSIDEASEKQVNFDSESTVFISGDDLRYPLVVRKWKAGDYFYPLGLRKKKKLARFFIDQKLSAIDKEKVWIVESDQKIVWVAGYRIDDRFKLLPSTKKMLRLTLTKPSL